MPTATVEVEIDGQRRSASAVGQRPARRRLEGDRRRARRRAASCSSCTRGPSPRARTPWPRSSFASRTGERESTGQPRAPTPSRPHAQGLPLGGGGGAQAAPRRDRSDGDGRGRSSTRSGTPTWSAARAKATPAVLYVDLPPRPRGDLAAGLHRCFGERGLRVRRPERTVATMDHSTPTTPRVATAGPSPRPLRRRRRSRPWRRTAATSRSRSTAGAATTAGNRPRHRTRAGPDPARADRSCAATATRARTGPSGRSPSASGRARSATSSPRSACSQRTPKTLRHRGRRAGCARGHREGPGPGHHRPDRRRRRDRSRHRVPRTAVRALSMEERMTVCNMSIEAGARAGLVAPDDDHLRVPGRAAVRPGVARSGRRRSRRWRTLPSATRAPPSIARCRSTPSEIEPMITWGTSPGIGIPIRGVVPQTDGDPGRREGAHLHGPRAGEADARPHDRRRVHRELHQRAALRPARRRRTCCRDGGWRPACARSSCRARRGQGAGRGRGPRPGLPRGGRGMARARLLDVHRHERRPAGARAVRGEHQQPELRPRPGRPPPDPPPARDQRPVIRKTPISSTEPKRFLVARSTR